MSEPGRKQREERQLHFSGGSSWVADPPHTPPGPLLAQQRCRGLPGGGTAKLPGEGTRKSGAGGPRRQGRSLAHPLGEGTALREPLPKLCFLLPGRCSAGRKGGREGGGWQRASPSPESLRGHPKHQKNDGRMEGGCLPGGVLREFAPQTSGCSAGAGRNARWVRSGLRGGEPRRGAPRPEPGKRVSSFW